jgi:putative transcriptional regulator
MTSFAGSFLIASPSLRDPNFARTVVLLLQHSEEGAFGLVVNRPARAEGIPFPVFAGGPCPAPGLFLLHGHQEWLDESDDPSGKEVAPAIYLGDATSLTRIADPEPGNPLRYRVFNGYAGWGPGQLEHEMRVGGWSTTPANGTLLFNTPPDELWDQLAPPALPQPSLN